MSMAPGGLTIFSIDQEDLYVYDTNPKNQNQYEYKNSWENFRIIEETFRIKGNSPRTVELKYSRHGPVVHEYTEHKKAYAVRAAWLETGAAPYLASLRWDQAASWEEFREACTFSRTPSENMLWADRYGNIGWQAVGIMPIRKNWYGLLPVPGDGRYEWDGYLPIRELPSKFNPDEGYIATANENNLPFDYPYRIGYSWRTPDRVNRIKEILETGRKFTITDMMRLQHDELSIPARTLVPFLEDLSSKDSNVRTAIQKMLSWDYVLDKNSIEATLFTFWEARLRSNVNTLTMRYFGFSSPNSALIQILSAPDSRFGKNAAVERDKLLVRSLEEGVKEIIGLLGSDMNNWKYGQEKVHYIKMNHMLSNAVNVETRGKFDLGPIPRGGGSTVNNTGSGNQRSGASFRVIADTGNWDNSVGTNNPGQSGDPESPHYSDLFAMWAAGDYFPLLYSRTRIERSAEKITVLNPKK